MISKLLDSQINLNLRIKKYNPFVVLLYFLVIFFLYYYTEKNTIPRYYIYSKLDDYIPFVEYMVIPYIMWFPYIGLSLYYFGIKSKGDFYRLLAYIYLSMTISFIFYMIFPNGHNLRPAELGDNVFSKLIGLIYKIDTDTNSFPSIHVLVSLGIHRAIVQSKQVKESLLLKALSLAITLSICSSTVFIKQHSILDVILAFILSVPLYILVFKSSFMFILKRVLALSK